MKTRLIVFCVFAAIFSLFVSCTNNENTSDLGAINGTVSDRNTGAAISNADVTLSPGGASRRTNSHGFYEFENLEPGAYSVNVQHNAYQTDQKPITVRGAGEIAVVNFSLVGKDEL